MMQSTCLEPVMTEALLDAETFEKSVMSLGMLIMKATRDLKMAVDWRKNRGQNVPRNELSWAKVNQAATVAHLVTALCAFLALCQDGHEVVVRPSSKIVHKKPCKAVRGANGRRKTRKPGAQPKNPASKNPASKETEAERATFARQEQDLYAKFYSLKQSLIDDNCADISGFGGLEHSFGTNMSPRAKYEWRMEEIKMRIESAYKCLLHHRMPVPPARGPPRVEPA